MTGRHSTIANAGSRDARSSPPVADSADDLAFTAVPSLDIFALSRVGNYLTRIGAGRTETVERTSSLPPVCRATLVLPVAVLENGALVTKTVQAVGIGTDEKAARVACCMHAEVCLDALGVPLFTSARRQKERAEEAARAGRRAPSHCDDAPNEWASVVLPPPVRHATQPPVSASPTKARKGAARASPSSSRAPPSVPVARMSSYQPNYRPAAHRRGDYRRHRVRYGPDPFFAQMTADMEQLRHSIFERSAAEEEDGEEVDGEDEAMGGAVPDSHSGSAAIDPSQVTVLAPGGEGASGGCEGQEGAWRRGQQAARAQRGDPLQVLARVTQPKRMGYSRISDMPRGDADSELLDMDESEGGIFEMAEAHGETWHWEEGVPGPMCIIDIHASERLREYFMRAHHAPFEDCVSIHTSEEPTPFVEKERRRLAIRSIGWFTATVPLPEVAGPSVSPGHAPAHDPPPYVATGKATSPEKAIQLCAMHAEALLGYTGIPIFSDVRRQVRHYAGSLAWGRCVSPVPRPEMGVDAPKPMKEWFLNTGRRYRACPMSVTERLLALNRCVVGMVRQHLVEIDLAPAEEGCPYAEALGLAESCVRQYMLSQGHPFEAAFFNFVFQEGSQYRCSVYLPLPDRFGVRGGCGIGSSPQRARQLAAFSAVDVLCALDAVPDVCHRHPDWQRMIAIRQEKGLILPDRRTADPRMRSPPSYREVRGQPTSRRLPLPQDVWRVMMVDADDFDVAPLLLFPASSASGGDSASSLPVGGPNSCAATQPHDWSVILPRLFHTAMRYHAGWSVEDTWLHIYHYCGAQHYRHQRRMAANNYWVLLPLCERRYGQRMALGRCVTRTGALRHLYIHVLRILHTLHAAPWEELDTKELLSTVYNNSAVRMSEELDMWAAVRRELLSEYTVSSTGAGDGGAKSSVPEAQVVSTISTTASATTPSTDAMDLRRQHSPHPGNVVRTGDTNLLSRYSKQCAWRKRNSVGSSKRHLSPPSKSALIAVA